MFDPLEEKSQALGLRINELKTKYIKMSSEDRRWTPTVTLGKYTFERVKCFSYLGTILNSKNMVTEEISRRTMAGQYEGPEKDPTVQALKGQALQDLD
jgi:hypothetical protein